MTAKCGFGHNGECCCECAHLLVAKPRCHHLGGKGPCGPRHTENLLERIDAEVKHQEEVDAYKATHDDTGFVCAAFAYEGIALTDWRPHGCCEMWEERKTRRVASD